MCQCSRITASPKVTKVEGIVTLLGKSKMHGKAVLPRTYECHGDQLRAFRDTYTHVIGNSPHDFTNRVNDDAVYQVPKQAPAHMTALRRMAMGRHYTWIVFVLLLVTYDAGTGRAEPPVRRR
jgi:hypothetical protein